MPTEATCGGKIPLCVGRRAQPLTPSSSMSSTLVSSLEHLPVNIDTPARPSPPVRPSTRVSAPVPRRSTSQSSSSSSATVESAETSGMSSDDTRFFSLREQSTSTIAIDEPLPVLPKSEEDLFASQSLDPRMTPLPRHPVATEIPPCREGNSVEHTWLIKALPCWRRYTCKQCAYVVEENKSKKTEPWGAHKSTLLLPSSHTHGPTPQPVRAATPSKPPGKGGRRKINPGPEEEGGNTQSSGTTAVPSPDPFYNARRLKGDPPTAAPSLSGPLTTVLVADNPKPSAPVATPNLDPCSGGQGSPHKWDLKNANGFARKYRCASCLTEVNERKKEGRWVSHDVIKR